MNKKAVSMLLAVNLFLAGLCGCSRPGSNAGSDAESSGDGVKSVQIDPSTVLESPPAEPQPEPLLPDPARLMETVDALCGEPRPLGSEAERRTAEYLQERLEEFGYRSELEPFAYNVTATTLGQRYRQVRELTGEALLAAALPGGRVDGESQNVIGHQTDAAGKELVLVLSAHYDSTADSLGVVDNAAGVAVVLEAARILAGEDLPFSLRIVFFGGEEEILLGSRQHLLGLDSGERVRILGNISVDTLAYSAEEEFAVLTPLLLPREDAAALAEASPVAAAFLADPRVSPEFRSRLVGDHLAFWAAGIDSVNFGQSMDAVVDVINSPADAYELLEPELLPVATGLLVDAVRELAARMEA